MGNALATACEAPLLLPANQYNRVSGGQSPGTEGRIDRRAEFLRLWAFVPEPFRPYVQAAKWNKATFVAIDPNSRTLTEISLAKPMDLLILWELSFSQKGR